MKYINIFNKAKGGDTISLTLYSVEQILMTNADYVSFCNEKIRLRKEFEKEYKPLFKGNLSFRVYLESLTNSILNNKPFYYEHVKWFEDQSERVKEEMTIKIKAFLALHSSIESHLLSFIWNSNNNINECFTKIRLKPFYLKGIFKDIFQLKNSQVGLTMFFELNKESIKIFVDEVKDDWGEKICYFQDVAIYEDNQVIFSSITHEDHYSFLR